MLIYDFRIVAILSLGGWWKIVLRRHSEPFADCHSDPDAV